MLEIYEYTFKGVSQNLKLHCTCISIVLAIMMKPELSSDGSSGWAELSLSVLSVAIWI